MPIKNMGSATMRFGEGIICSGSDNSSALEVYANVSGEYAAVVDNDQSSNGHVLKLRTDGNGSGSRVLEMEDGDGDIIFRARADGRFGFGPDGVDSMGAGTFVVGIDNSSHTSDIAISRRLQHLGDSDTYLDFAANDSLQLFAGNKDLFKGTATAGVVINEGGDAAVDFRVESDTNDHMFFVDSGNNKVGIGTSSPGTVLHVDGGTDAVRATANSGHLILGPTNATNMVLDGNEIIARNNGQAATLYLNHESGGVHIGDYDGNAVAESLRVSGATVLSGSVSINIGGDGDALKLVGTDQHETRLIFEQPAGQDRASIELDAGDNLDIKNYSPWDDINFMTSDGSATPVTTMVLTSARRTGLGKFGWEGKAEYGTSESFPSCELDVSGSLKISETATITGATSIEPFVVETKNALQGTSTATAVLRDESFSGLSNKDFSFSCWYYANDSNTVGLDSNTRIIFFGAGEHHNLKLGMPDAQLIYENHAGSNSTATFDSNLAEGNWYHIVAHFDVGDLSNGVPKLWVNGVEQSSSGYSAVGGTAATIDDVAIYLDDGAAMQDAVFWDKLLTQDEINEIYDAGFWQDPSQTSISKNIVSWFKLGYEPQWAGAGFNAGDTLSGTQTIQDEIGVNEFEMTTENEFALMARSVNRRSKSDFAMDSTLLAGQVTVKDSFDVTNKSTFGGAVEYGVRDVNSTSTVEPNDYVLRCIQNGAITITLPPKNDHRGRVLIFKDALGNAGTHNITIDADGSETIDGSANYVINQNRDAVTLICDGINGWMVIG